MNEVMVSIYCLAYNHEDYIKNALEGFVNQKVNFRYEVFVHDDASTDNTPKIIKEYSEKYPNIIIPIFQETNQYSNGGRIVQRFIRDKMHGKYIGVCEGDDYWTDPNKLQKQIDFLEEHTDYVACVHESTVLNCINGKTSVVNGRKENYTITIEDVIKSGNCAYQISSLIYRKYLFDNRPSCLRTKSFGDYSLALHLANSGKVYYMADNMSTYRLMSKNSWTYKSYTNKDMEKRLYPYYESIKMLEGFNDLTNRQYEILIRNVIEHKKYEIAIIKREKKKIFNEYLIFFKKESINQKIKILLKLYFPVVESIYRKI